MSGEARKSTEKQDQQGRQKDPQVMAPTPVIALTGWNKLRHW